MKFSYQNVSLSKIDIADASFRISTADASAALIGSINSLGLLNPPALIHNSNRYIIVAGFARVQACNSIGIKEIPARILSTQTPLKACVQFAIMDKVFQRDLNLVEQARAVRMLSKACSESDELMAFVQQAGLSINQKMVKKLLAVGQMPDMLQKGIILGAISLPVALQLNLMTGQEDRDEITRLFIELNLSLNRQRELMEWITAVTKRDKITATELLAEGAVQKIRLDSDMDRRQKVSQIWHQLKRRRSPEISSFETRYRALINNLKIKKGVRLVAPPNFEGTTYTLQVDFKNLTELKEMEQELSRIVRSSHMSDILGPIKK